MKSLRISAGLGLEFEMWQNFDTKQKSLTLFDCVDCVLLYGLPCP